MKPSGPKKYTKPALRDKSREEVVEGDKGGKPGEWSARKAQLVATEYEHAGGGFKGDKDQGAESLSKWGKEDWHTSDGAKAEREGGTTRYLPDEAWNKLSPEEKAKTNKKKQEGSRKGKQFVPNTEAAKEAGAEARKAPAKKSAGKKAAAKKAPGKSAGTKASAKKAPAKKSSAKKSPAKTAAKKAAAKKSTAKTASRSKSSAKQG